MFMAGVVHSASDFDGVVVEPRGVLQMQHDLNTSLRQDELLNLVQVYQDTHWIQAHET